MNYNNNFLKYSDNVLFFKSKDYTFCYQPRITIIDEYNPSEFELHIFKKNNSCENDIHVLKIEHERSGWIFPIQALQSMYHDYKENEHFLKYAYVALLIILSNIEKKDEDYEIDICDYYDVSDHIIIYEKSNVSKIKDFNFENYLVSLSTYGYTKTGNINAIRTIDRNINLRRVSTEIPNINYINSMYETLSLDLKPYTKFNIMYQIIEIFISFIFKSQFEYKLKSLNLHKDNLFDFKRGLDDIVNEKNRVKLLFNSYSKVSSNSILIELCRTFIKNCTGKESVNNDNATCIYEVRSLVVHNMYKIKESDYELLDKINYEFLKALEEIIFSYKIPCQFIVAAI